MRQRKNVTKFIKRAYRDMGELKQYKRYTKTRLNIISNKQEPFTQNLTLHRLFRKFYLNLKLKQFKLLYKKYKGNEKVIIQQLEKRVDMVLLRSGFVRSLYEARQIINHKHLLVNGKIASLPGYMINVGDIISFKEGSMKRKLHNITYIYHIQVSCDIFVTKDVYDLLFVSLHTDFLQNHFQEPFTQNLTLHRLFRKFYLNLKLKQFKLLYKKYKGNEKVIIQQLEKRVDMVLLRSGFVRSLYEARQIINHKHLLVNGKIASLPGYMINNKVRATGPNYLEISHSLLLISLIEEPKLTAIKYPFTLQPEKNIKFITLLKKYKRLR
ncbi:hypothetical protein ACTFIT_007050 [Dictyostelium discoideum]